jgi:hypothetical protein
MTHVRMTRIRAAYIRGLVLTRTAANIRCLIFRGPPYREIGSSPKTESESAGSENADFTLRYSHDRSFENTDF